MASGYSDLSQIQGDRRTYGSHSKPPKINLLNEKPRRESLIEQQLTSTITRPLSNNQRVEQQQVGTFQQQVYGPPRSQNTNQFDVSIRGNATTNYDTSSLDNFLQEPGMSGLGYRSPGPNYQPSSMYYPPEMKTIKTTVTTTTASSNEDLVTAYGRLEADLAAKEAKLNKELAYLNQYNSPWSRPKQIREPRREAPARVHRNDPRWVKECPSASPSPRPTSRASSTRSTTEADLMEKAEKLLKDAEDLERKPLKKQELLIETGSMRPNSSEGQQVGSVHTTIISVPNHEIDNKSPLPFAYDNFSTLGVRGNIASVGATEPESPYPPIFPTIKRTPSPSNYRRN